MEFRHKLRHMRQQAGWTQEQLVREMQKFSGMSVSKSTLSNWEHGQHTPKLKDIDVLSRIFGVSPEYWVFDEVVDPNKKPASLDENQTMILRIVAAGKLTADQILAALLHGEERPEKTA